MYIKEDIKKSLLKILKKEPYKVQEDQLVLEEPNNLDFGDYATNIAMRLAKPLQKGPKDIAEELINIFNKEINDYDFSNINGFINIKINDDKLFSEISNIDEKYGDQKIGKGQKVLLEYVSANPTGPLHIGHGRWAAIGNVLYRVLSKCGYKADREFYINDTGKQILNFTLSVEAVRNNEPIPEDGYHGSYIQELAKEDGDPVEKMIEHQKETMKKIAVEFDTWFSEKELHESDQIDKTLAFLKKNNFIYKSEGATWFKSSQFGDDKDCGY